MSTLWNFIKTFLKIMFTTISKHDFLLIVYSRKYKIFPCIQFFFNFFLEKNFPQIPTHVFLHSVNMKFLQYSCRLLSNKLRTVTVDHRKMARVGGWRSYFANAIHRERRHRASGSMSCEPAIYRHYTCNTWYWYYTTKYFIGCVTLFFANNYLTEYWITMEVLHNFF